MKNKQREDKTCLNCGTQVEDKYCPHCGQENRDPRESIGELINHFFADITHYDSKFFKSIKDLCIRPGFLTREYLAGRRMRYLNPVRMYVFISFTFFLVYFTFFSSINKIQGTINYTPAQIAQADSAALHFKDSILNSSLNEIQDSQLKKQVMTSKSPEVEAMIREGLADYSTTAQFDSAQLALPPSQRLGKLPRFLMRKWVSMKQEYGDRRGPVLWDDFKHNIPKLMFILLPLFAVLLKFFYKWRKYFYVDHVIFSIHFHSFIFLLFLVCQILDVILHSSFFANISILVIWIYFVIALKNTYHQPVFKSLLKSCLIGICYSIILLFGLVFTAALTFITI